MTYLDPTAIAAIFLALALGGTLKGATGAGAPLVAIPVIAAFFDVRLAVAVMVVPNLLTNIWQIWTYRVHWLTGGFALSLALGGAVGAVLGTVLLASLSAATLSVIVGAVILAYILLRLVHPSFAVPMPLARRLAFPVGTVAGVLQGAAGMSGPVSLSFMNALRLDRPVFIVTISTFFAVMTVAQIPALMSYGIATPHTLILGLTAMIPQMVFMPVGAWLARSLTRERFDQVILVLLGLLALKLLAPAVGL